MGRFFRTNSSRSSCHPNRGHQCPFPRRPAPRPRWHRATSRACSPDQILRVHVNLTQHRLSSTGHKVARSSDPIGSFSHLYTRSDSVELVDSRQDVVHCFRVAEAPFEPRRPWVSPLVSSYFSSQRIDVGHLSVGDQTSNGWRYLCVMSRETSETKSEGFRSRIDIRARTPRSNYRLQC